MFDLTLVLELNVSIKILQPRCRPIQG